MTGDGGTGGLLSTAEEYLAIRRRLGYELVTPGRLVCSFARDCDSAAITVVTVQVALEWATRPQGVADLTWWYRLSALRGFAAYLHARDPRHQILPRELLPRRPQRPTPSMLWAAAVDALIAVAPSLRPPLHRALQTATYQTLIALLAVTGMRPGEAVRLDDDDIDWDQGMLTVRGKNGIERKLLLHATTIAALAGYVRLRDQTLGRRAVRSLLVTTAGTRLQLSQAGKVFADLVTAAGLQQGTGSRPPTLMSLRHTFAVSTLIRWLSDGADIQARLPVLSTWLGHRNPQSTYWYLEAVPELLQAVSDYTLQITGEQAPLAVPATIRRAHRRKDQRP